MSVVLYYQTDLVGCKLLPNLLGLGRPWSKMEWSDLRKKAPQARQLTGNMDASTLKPRISFKVTSNHVRTFRRGAPEQWLGKHKFQEDKARKEQFEKDKALKDKKPTPWSKEAWQAAAARNRAGVIKPQRRFPIIITSSTGPLSTPQKIQEVAGLSSLPEVQWTTKTSFSDLEEGSKGLDGENSEKVQYCDVNWEQLVRVKEYSDGEDVLIWFQGNKRVAWLAHLVKQKSGNQINDRMSQATWNLERK